MSRIRLPRNLFVLLLALAAVLVLACLSSVPPASQPASPQASLPPLVVISSTSPVETAITQNTVVPLPDPTATPTATKAPPPLTPTPQAVRFAVIGDYGKGEQAEADVASLVKSWTPDFIITVGDNNYPDGAPETIDRNIGQFYHEYIYPYDGAYGAGADKLRFFPTLGNHDWNTDQAQAYFDYFVLPGNERYYDFVWGPIHFFALDSDSREPDGVGSGTPQAEWLQGRLAASTARWKVVYMHHPPYSSGPRGPVDWMRWPFQEWGASVLLAGHDHFYERLSINGLPLIINGLGGGAIYGFAPPAQGSLVRYNQNWGAMLVVADNQQMTFQFMDRQGQMIDQYQLLATP